MKSGCKYFFSRDADYLSSQHTCILWMCWMSHMSLWCNHRFKAWFSSCRLQTRFTKQRFHQPFLTFSWKSIVNPAFRLGPSKKYCPHGQAQPGDKKSHETRINRKQDDPTFNREMRERERDARERGRDEEETRKRRGRDERWETRVSSQEMPSDWLFIVSASNWNCRVQVNSEWIKPWNLDGGSWKRHRTIQTPTSP